MFLYKNQGFSTRFGTLQEKFIPNRSLEEEISSRTGASKKKSHP